MTILDQASSLRASGRSADDRTARRAVAAMAFLGAFLSFSMQPIVGRMVTPFFGGAVHVWVVSLMMFQALLLVGYAYAHLIAPRIGPWHLLLLLLPLLQWPLGFTSEITPTSPVLALTAALLAQISLPFAVLCTTAVVAQSWWYGASSGGRRSEPYFLYGVSNVGAIAALFVYPFLVEPLFGVTVQRWAWSIGYLLYAGVTAWTWLVLRPQRAAATNAAVSSAAPRTVVRWLALSAATSALLLAVTNAIAMEVGSVPMVWVFPLALYLASFIVTFRERQGRGTHRLHFWMFEIALLALLAPVAIGNGWALPLLLTLFFALCVVAHAQLYRLRPHPSGLTSYYLTIATGGLAGGVLVSLVAPVSFNGLQEYPLAVLAVVAASWRGTELAWWQNASRLKGYLRLTFVVVAGMAFGGALWKTSSAVHASRNFYGVARVVDETAPAGQPPYRMLVHGATLHGMQYLASEHRREPLSYYYAGGALAQAVAERVRTEPVAMIGLGAGGAIPWFGPGEDVTVFEIDPDMEGLARNWFSYLDDTPARVRVRVGDARLNLHEEGRTNALPYGVLFVDAFSGDGIPTHLMTLEAMDVYLSRLAPDGLLVFHVSNRYYDFRPVLKAAARARGLAAIATLESGKPTAERVRIDPSVVVLTRRPERLALLLEKGTWATLGRGDGLPEFRAWTDDYVNVLAPLATMWTRPRLRVDTEVVRAP